MKKQSPLEIAIQLTAIGMLPPQLLIRTKPLQCEIMRATQRDILVSVKNATGSKDVYSLHRDIDLSHYSSDAVALRKAYAYLSGIPLGRLNKAIALVRKDWVACNKDQEFQQLLQKAENAGFRLVPKETVASTHD